MKHMTPEKEIITLEQSENNTYFLNANFRFLRKLCGWTQVQYSEYLDIKRASVASYEEGKSSPKLDRIIKIANYFEISLDDIINKNLEHFCAENGLHTREDLVAKLKQLSTPQAAQNAGKSTSDNYIKGEHLRLLTISVDEKNRNNIELVPQTARAGYVAGFADQEYIEQLDHFQLPFLSPNATYRAFEIEGDSMPPLQTGSYIIGEYVEDWTNIKDGKTYIFVTQEGLLYKRAQNHLKNSNTSGEPHLWLFSDNLAYSPIKVEVSQLLEVWEAKAAINTDLPTLDDFSDYQSEQLLKAFQSMQKDIAELKSRQ